MIAMDGGNADFAGAKICNGVTPLFMMLMYYIYIPLLKNVVPRTRINYLILIIFDY